jgi:hypothetical protein
MRKLRTLGVPLVLLIAMGGIATGSASASWTEVDRVSGAIVDVTSDRILLREGDALKVKDRQTAAVTTVPSVAGQTPVYGFLTSHGAIYVASQTQYPYDQLYEWRDGALVDLGPADLSSLDVAGNYAIWSSDRTLRRRDLDLAVTTTVAINAGNTQNHVAANGDVAYWSYPTPDYEVFRYRNGASQQLTSDSSVWNTYPLTDGINVAYNKISPCCDSGSVALYTSSGELVLDSFRNARPSPGADYALAGGWVAYTRPDADGNLQTWTRSPSGAEAQRSPDGLSTRIVGLNEKGEVLFRDVLPPGTHGDQDLHLSLVGGSSIDLGATPSTTRYAGSSYYFFWDQGHWFEVADNILSRLDLPTYPRPKGATPVVAALVTAFEPCADPNTTHGAPLTAPACDPPAYASSYVTPGTFDANQRAPKMLGSVRADVIAGNPATAVDEADVRLSLALTDIRRKSDLEDYTGELRAVIPVSVTDRDNVTPRASGNVDYTTDTTPIEIFTETDHGLETGDRVLISGTEQPVSGGCSDGLWTVTVTGPISFTLDGSVGCSGWSGGTFQERGDRGPYGTTQETPISFNASCAPTADTTVGATCTADTTMEALLPGSVKEGLRAIWELGQIRVYDGGADGDADTPSGDTLFATQGIFVP